ncbi:hypothetical protein IWX90DRAFT_504327 [Phyllosticta citrichinensis]|uniref:Uncharacterized protein n=1 Tax=Phyllosticta citrichinensis TaxID=1130410 RepID=A0ABR1XPP3_9PEZI
MCLRRDDVLASPCPGSHLQLPSLASHLTFHRLPLGSSVRHLHVALVLFPCYLHRHISNCSATMDYAPAEQHGNAEPHSAFSFTWVIITWDIIVIAPMVLLWYFGFLTLEGDVVPHTGPGPRRYHRVRLTPEERELLTDPRPHQHRTRQSEQADLEEEETIDHEFLVMAHEWEDDLREARRLARQERLRRLNAHLRSSVAGVRSTFAAATVTGGERREMETQTQTDVGAGVAASTLVVRGTRQGQRHRRQSTHGRRRFDVDQHNIGLHLPHRPRPSVIDYNRLLPPLPPSKSVASPFSRRFRDIC